MAGNPRVSCLARGGPPARTGVSVVCAGARVKKEAGATGGRPPFLRWLFSGASVDWRNPSRVEAECAAVVWWVACVGEGVWGGIPWSAARGEE